MTFTALNRNQRQCEHYWIYRAGLASIKETPLRLLVNALTRTLEAAKTLSDYPTNWNFTKTTIKKL